MSLSFHREKNGLGLVVRARNLDWVLPMIRKKQKILCGGVAGSGLPATRVV